MLCKCESSARISLFLQWVTSRDSHLDSNCKGTRYATSAEESVLAKEFGSDSTEFIEFSVSGVPTELGPFRHATMEGISCP